MFGYNCQMVHGFKEGQLVIPLGQVNLAEEKERTVISEDESDKVLHYVMALFIRHPSIDPKIITTELRLKPYRYWRFGARCSTPRGTPLKGLWTHSYWVWVNPYKGNRAFFNSADELLDRLEAHRAFLLDLVSDGGTVCLILDILGKHNIGDELSFRSMEKMVNLKIDLGIEVFSEMNDWGGETKIIKPLIK